MPKRAGVYKRGKVWWIRYTNAVGEQVRESAKTESQEEAVAHLERERAKSRDEALGIRRKRRGVTLGELRTLWLERAESKHAKAIPADRQRWKLIIELLGEAMTVESLTDEALVKFRAALQKRKTRRGKVTSPATANRVVALLRAAVRACAADCDVPATRWPMAKERSRNAVYTAAEIDALQAAAIATGQPALALAIHIAATNPIRLGAIASMRWEQIDFTAAEVRLDALQTKEGKPLVVDLIPETVEHLKAWKAEQAAHAKTLPEGLPYPGQVFQYKPPGTQVLSSAFARLRRSIGIDDRRFHDLKRTTVSRLLMSGATTADVSEMSATSAVTISKSYSAGLQRKRDLLTRAAKVGREGES